jgi:hypothetical protein
MKTPSTIGILAVLIAPACGSSSGSTSVGTSSGLPRASTVASLNATQDATLCDWSNAKEGGYGRSFNCPDGGQMMSDPDQASCVGTIMLVGSSCPSLTVGDIEDCGNASGTNLCSVPTLAGCAVFNACVATIPP